MVSVDKEHKALKLTSHLFQTSMSRSVALRLMPPAVMPLLLCTNATRLERDLSRSGAANPKCANLILPPVVKILVSVRFPEK